MVREYIEMEKACWIVRTITEYMGWKDPVHVCAKDEQGKNVYPWSSLDHVRRVEDALRRDGLVDEYLEYLEIVMRGTRPCIREPEFVLANARQRAEAAARLIAEKKQAEGTPCAPN